jgi:hypothetical protein
LTDAVGHHERFAEDHAQDRARLDRPDVFGDLIPVLA